MNEVEQRCIDNVYKVLACNPDATDAEIVKESGHSLEDVKWAIKHLKSIGKLTNQVVTPHTDIGNHRPNVLTPENGVQEAYESVVPKEPK